MGRIRILADEEARRIAAGEVVERPASVVRELVDNALDAGAARIEIGVGGGGAQRLSIADDGEGMDQEDAVRCLSRHATSKISSLSDLGRIRTLGFRGEALPAIAAVCRLDILTSTGKGEGTRVEADEGVVRRVSPAARSRGTTVTVMDLFQNTPARRKFLRRPATEFTRLLETLLPAMIVRPEVAFRVEHEGREAVAVAATADRRERIAALWGVRLAERLVPFRGEAAGVCVSGFLSGPDEHRASRRDWYTFVNDRPVRDRLLAHAVSEGLGAALPKGRQPILFLFLEIPAVDVDVNVHPAKSEVRLADPGRVHALVATTVRRAAAPVALMPTLAGSTLPSGAKPEGSPLSGIREAVARYAAASPGQARRERPLLAPVSRLPESGSDALSGIVVLAQYRDCFIVAHDDDALYLIDQHAAHERILYEDRWRDMQTGGGRRQALLFPLVVDVTPGTGEVVEAALPRLEQVGFVAERFGTGSFVLREAPDLLPPGRVEAAFRGLIDAAAMGGEDEGGQPDGRDRLRHRLAATLACHAAVRLNDRLGSDEMERLVRDLFRCDEPLTCPHGRVAVTRWTHPEILRAFGRA